MEKKDIKPRNYWTYERCYEEALKYNTRNEFRTHSNSAYMAAWRNNWLDDYTWLKIDGRAPKGYWLVYEHCEEEALKYTSRTDFMKNAPGAYYSSIMNGWIDKFDWFIPTKELMSKVATIWTRESCYKAAMGFTQKSMFCKKCRGAYEVAKKNGWLSDYIWLKNSKHEVADYWVYAYEDKENKVVYVGLTWRKERHTEHKRKGSVYKYFTSIGKDIPNPRILIDGLTAEQACDLEDWYRQAYADNGWTVLNKAKTGVGSSSLGSNYIIWTKDKVIEEAKKYNTRTEFYKNSGSAYDAARRNNWLDDLGFNDTRIPSSFWTYEKIGEVAKNYEKISDFEDEYPSACRIARQNGWLDCFFNRVKKTNNYWGKENCREEASKYTSRVEFQKGNGSAYAVARKNGWLKEFFPERICREPYTFEEFLEKQKEATIKVRFKEKYPSLYTKARQNGWLSKVEWDKPNLKRKKVA